MAGQEADVTCSHDFMYVGVRYQIEQIKMTSDGTKLDPLFWSMKYEYAHTYTCRKCLYTVGRVTDYISLSREENTTPRAARDVWE